MHAGTEVHFYSCDSNTFIAYPYNTDDYPFSDMSSGIDHEGYFCLAPNPA